MHDHVYQVFLKQYMKLVQQYNQVEIIDRRMLEVKLDSFYRVDYKKYWGFKKQEIMSCRMSVLFDVPFIKLFYHEGKARNLTDEYFAQSGVDSALVNAKTQESQIINPP